MSNIKSPAVTALEIEQKAQRLKGDDGVDGLEDTFPASDPVASAAAGVSVAHVSREADAPRVDEALQSILDHRNDPYVEAREHAAAIRDEVRSLGDRGSDRMAGLRAHIKAKPLQAVGIAALIGFAYGLIR